MWNMMLPDLKTNNKDIQNMMMAYLAQGLAQTIGGEMLKGKKGR